MEPRHSILLYWKEAGGQDSGWYAFEQDASGNPVESEGPVGDYGDMAKGDAAVAQGLYTESYGPMSWEEVGELRFVGRPA